MSRIWAFDIPHARLSAKDSEELCVRGIKFEGIRHVVLIEMHQAENKWKTPPYNSKLFSLGTGNIGTYRDSVYWLLSVIERAKSTDAEKIIKVWEGDSFRMVNGKVIKMRPCDHKAIQDFSVTEYVAPDQQKVSMTVPPHVWLPGASYTGPAVLIPAGKALPWMDPKLERCKGKNGWGN